MKNLKTILLVTLLALISTATSAADFRTQQRCKLIESLSLSDTSNVIESLKVGSASDVSPFEQVRSRVSPLLDQSRLIVKNNCLQGKQPSAIRARLTALWTQGCAPISNPGLRSMCMRFKESNDGTNLEKFGEMHPAFTALIEAPASADCSPGVSDVTGAKDLTPSATQGIIEETAVSR